MQCSAVECVLLGKGGTRVQQCGKGSCRDVCLPSKQGRECGGGLHGGLWAVQV